MVPTAQVTADELDRYALELAKRPNDTFGAASQVAGGDVGRALEIMSAAREDAGFPDRQRNLVAAQGAESFLPSKEEIEFEIIQVARNSENDDLKLRAYRLVAEMNAWIKKDGSNVNIQNNITQNRVMVVQEFATEADWEASTRAQQSKLIEDANTSIAKDTIDADAA